MPKVEIYTKATCPFCIRAKRLLDMKGIDYEEYEISRDEAKRAEMIERSGGGTTVPQIFINDEPIGGCDDMFALERKGELDERLAA
ncbi:glutaredoxin 3 [Sphingomicrobium astaxanthinifaciens]|uniref:glutaredoxin 3 n=1 Tax=Sphingomicrobium astaxanthinifaciens TaxID=1227949 RepID=UPI001FCCBD1B|nr:glutaredoxin 3 [Sphingomicrobium astaxanthinifaciens]MCJ7420620.1 glutaredoxin 3 [Sphingomicrobium astaxanthinifaciens]